jgi:phospholipid N-methyltransferase
MQKIIITILSLTFVSSAFAMDAMDRDRGQESHTSVLTSVGVKEGEEVDPDFSAKLIHWDDTTKPRPTDNKFGTICNHGYIQPQFVDAVLEKPGLDVLEVGPGDGLVLQKILTDARNQFNPVRYTMVEPCTSHLKQIDTVIETYNKNDKNWFGKAKNGDIRQFIVGKEKKYDLILCSQVLHFFDPLDQLQVLMRLRNALKDNGRLYLITNSLLSLNIWVMGKDSESVRKVSNEYIREIKENQEKGDLWSGYHLNSIFMGQRLAIKKQEGFDYDAPTVHSPSTLIPLLKAVGFQVNECQNFTEITESSIYAPSIRLGAVATRAAEMNMPLIKEYLKQAQEKREKRKEIEKFMEDNSEFIALMVQLISAQHSK